jgi:hypothetical protein
VALARTDVLENVSSPSSGVLRLIDFHDCITVETLLLGLFIERYYYWSKNTVFWDAFTAGSIKDAFWDFVSCIIKSQKTSLTDTVMNASQKTVFFDH